MSAEETKEKILRPGRAIAYQSGIIISRKNCQHLDDTLVLNIKKKSYFGEKLSKRRFTFPPKH